MVCSELRADGEICFQLHGRLVGVSIRCRRTGHIERLSLLRSRSLGSLSRDVLSSGQLAWGRSRGGRYHYLGLYVGACDKAEL